MMPQLCGKPFFEKRKLPVPVRVSHGSARAVAAAVRRAMACTHALVGAGQTSAVKVGRADMTPAQVADNAMFVAARLVNVLPRKWRGVMSGCAGRGQAGGAIARARARAAGR